MTASTNSTADARKLEMIVTRAIEDMPANVADCLNSATETLEGAAPAAAAAPANARAARKAWPLPGGAPPWRRYGCADCVPFRT